MANRDIIVMGASAGGLPALNGIIKQLPHDLNAAVFIVWHVSPHSRSMLPEILSRAGKLEVKHPADGESIQPGKIYVARPDRHLLLEAGRVRLTKGPKENRFRPAVDPLFRSAAYAYGARVVGVVLTGALDDGTAGLWAIKDRGGIAVVQDPAEAEQPSMPSSALNNVQVDYCLPISEIPPLMVTLTQQSVGSKPICRVQRTGDRDKNRARRRFSRARCNPAWKDVRVHLPGLSRLVNRNQQRHAAAFPLSYRAQLRQRQFVS